MIRAVPWIKPEFMKPIESHRFADFADRLEVFVTVYEGGCRTIHKIDLELDGINGRVVSAEWRFPEGMF